MPPAEGAKCGEEKYALPVCINWMCCEGYFRIFKGPKKILEGPKK